ncbi:disintegrin and metalloproteinase domain-containing protein 30 [Perognathus longimembris pacificus]|uniref:disintegrin and metalloproteinase domain-containing protein 30 n=1 Tax=Perognathus longimembris pacificus TaxID=214514 RepID=UPI002019DDE1|nr:disintegrin and metalloproteinase domain-containing protein 30 [Perognathus longimembris pacificus]
MGPDPGGWPAMLGLALLLPAALGEEVLLRPEWGFESYEITVPKELQGRGGGGPGWPGVSYLLRLGGRPRVLRLWPKRALLPHQLPVVSFSARGEPLEDLAHFPRDCHFAGSVDGAEGSGATLSMCAGGLRGVIRVDAEDYQIQPLAASSRFEHIVYLLKPEPADAQACGWRAEEWGASPNPAPRMRDYVTAYKHQRYLELVLVFDQGRFSASKGNLSRVVVDATLLTAIMDTYFQDMQLRIFLAGLEVWPGKNKINLEHSTLDTVLEQFVYYRAYTLQRQIPGDWAHLYVSKTYTDAGAWSRGRVCDVFRTGSVSSFPDVNVLTAATWSAHELGHSLGMAHDQAYCQCRKRTSCIMGTGRTGFSNCSYIDYFKFVSQGASCLTNIPKPPVPYKKCGNKVVEKWEQCDCGSLEECQKDPCCEADCKLAPGANCSFGLCCQRCKFLPSGHMCREEENECDLPEYCNGVSHLCPKDTYKQDGTPCKYEGQCFSKGCRSRYMQCQSIFGPDAREGPRRCYEAVNLVGDQYGNCEIKDVTSYVKCSVKNVLCGRLQCINVKEIPDLPEHSLIISTYLKEENLMCWGTGYHLSMQPMGIPDPGAISDGTYCGDKQICVKRTCVNYTTLLFDCLSKKCNGRGVCNMQRNCHCLYGWAPPFCEETGFGGSIDSGPPGPIRELVPSSIQIVLLMLLRLILFAITVVIVLFRQAIIKCFTP